MKKSQIRKKILNKRVNSDFKNKKINFFNLLRLLNHENKNKKIGFYYPIGSELSTLELIECLRKKKIYYLFTSFRKKF